MRAVIKRTMKAHERCNRGNHEVVWTGHTWYALVWQCRYCDYFEHRPCDCEECVEEHWPKD